MARSKRRWYVVTVGRIPGVYTTWGAAAAQVNGVPGASYEGFSTEEAARREYERALAAGEVRTVRAAAHPSVDGERMANRTGSRHTTARSRAMPRTQSEQSVHSNEFQQARPTARSRTVTRTRSVPVAGASQPMRPDTNMRMQEPAYSPSRTPTHSRAFTAASVSSRTTDHVGMWRNSASSPGPTTPPMATSDSGASSPETGVTQMTPMILSPRLGPRAPVLTPQIGVVTSLSWPDSPATRTKENGSVNTSMNEDTELYRDGECARELPLKRSYPFKKVAEWDHLSSDLADDDRLWVPTEPDTANISIRKAAHQQSNGKGKERAVKLEMEDQEQVMYGQASTPGPARQRSVIGNTSPLPHLPDEHPDYHNSPPRSTSGSGDMEKYKSAYAHAFASCYAHWSIYGDPINTDIHPENIGTPTRDFSFPHGSQAGRPTNRQGYESTPSSRGGHSRVTQPDRTYTSPTSTFPGFSPPLHMPIMSIDPQADPRSPFSKGILVPLPWNPSSVGRPSPHLNLSNAMRESQSISAVFSH